VSEQISERIKELEDRLKSTVANKHTQKSINYIKSQLAKLRDEQVRITSSKRGGGYNFSVKKSGDAQVAFVGFPSVGKSSLLNILTDGATNSKVAAYNFTTLVPVPGMMEIESAKIQLIDLPGIILGAAEGKGRGREILAVVRSADLILIIIDIKSDGSVNTTDLESIREELFSVGVRLNQEPAHMKIVQRQRGGVGVSSNVPLTQLDREQITSLLHEFGVRNADVYLYEDINADQLIDHVMGNRSYIREFVIVNKCDLADEATLARLPEILGTTHYLPVSATNGTNIAELKHAIFVDLDLIKVYLKEPGEDPDYDEPMVIHKGSTLEDICRQIHRDFVTNFRFAYINGPSARHPNQRFSRLDHVVEDGDVITIVLQRG
jgi:small GTP-binding protein